MKWLINSMLGYWMLLLVISLTIACGIYEIWLKGSM
jgi:hypothetical protein